MILGERNEGAFFSTAGASDSKGMPGGWRVSRGGLRVAPESHSSLE